MLHAIFTFLKKYIFQILVQLITIHVQKERSANWIYNPYFYDYLTYLLEYHIRFDLFLTKSYLLRINSHRTLALQIRAVAIPRELVICLSLDYCSIYYILIIVALSISG